MRSVVHALPSGTPGTRYELAVSHFGGAPGPCAMKVYIQAALHADEVPSMLVAHLLQRRLAELEAQGQLRAEVVLLTCANPLGLAQSVLGTPIGRFELGSGQNFNRGFPFLFEKIAAAVEGRLGDDAERNTDLIRSAWLEALNRMPARTAFEALQLRLMQLAHDADVVLDLHCSREAAIHLYTGEAIWPEVQPLARYLGAQASLLALDAGAQSFDEAFSFTWYQLQQRFGRDFPIAQGSLAVTVEHRGQRDVSYAMAEEDASAILNYLMHLGAIEGLPPELPALAAPATPLAGSEQFIAPMAGILVYLSQVGARVRSGDALFDIVDPVSGQRTTIRSGTEGVFYMGRDSRFVRQGDPLGRVSGSQPIRSGKLLSA